MKSNTKINLQILVLSVADKISHARLCLPTQNRIKKSITKKKGKQVSFYVLLCAYGVVDIFITGLASITELIPTQIETI